MRMLLVACLLILASLSPGCGGEDAGQAKGEGESEAQASVVRGPDEATMDGVTGPSGATLARWLTTSERTGGVRLVPEGWTVTEIEIEQWVNDGDEVDPIIRGNFSGQARLDQTLYRLQQRLETLESYATDELRLAEDGDRVYVTGKPVRDDAVLVVEPVHEAPKTVDLFGKFTATKLAGQWVPMADPDTGRPGFMLTFLDRNPLEPTGTPASGFEGELLVADTPEYEQYTRTLAERRVAYDERLRELSAERQDRLDERRRLAAQAEERRRAALFAEKTPRAREALGNGRVWISSGSLPGSILTILELDQWDATTGVATGHTYVVGGWQRYREQGWGLHRQVSAQLAEGDGLAVTVTEGEDLTHGLRLQRQPAAATLELSLDDSGERLTGQWRRDRRSGTIEFTPMVGDQLQAMREHVEHVPLGRTYEIGFPTHRGTDPTGYNAQLELIGAVEPMGLILARARTTDTTGRLPGTWDRLLVGSPVVSAEGAGMQLDLHEFDRGPDDSGHSGMWRWTLDLDAQGDVTGGTVYVHHTESEQYSRPITPLDPDG